MCQIVYKLPEPENAMLLHYELFAYDHIIAFHCKIEKNMLRFMQYNEFLEVNIEPWGLLRFTISLSLLWEFFLFLASFYLLLSLSSSFSVVSLAIIITINIIIVIIIIIISSSSTVIANIVPFLFKFITRG